MDFAELKFCDSSSYTWLWVSTRSISRRLKFDKFFDFALSSIIYTTYTYVSVTLY